ncbi:hypothetical protein GCM10011519_08160 [Marmoricola endophyticus]|uniref:Glycosyl transferase n=1 Tax=Marmoricola endophyticus TaxID=2040280 RepID=A0A917BDY5_9ACTN|nr:hypothetical protein GCM10011519_08160 [Marmoricola endophyticus]
MRGRPDDPAWVRPALLGLLALTALLYLWDLGASGWANSFYSAAVQAGSESWKAFFFGSSDASNAITVDKTPLALWPMALSVRIFGLHGWAILLPQALEGMATVGLLYAGVRRWTGSPAAGLIAGATMALTPVAVLMFKFNNPDAMLALLLVGAAYATLRALEAGRTGTRGYVGHPVRWLALAGALVGLAFLAKQLQAFLILPALVLVYLVVAAVPLRKRIGHLLVAFVAMVVGAGWWIAIVSLWPAASRPYIGGSQDNSILELTLGYNGLGRITGDETGSVGGGGGNGGGMWGSTGILRLFGSEIGGQVAWLLPAALIALVAALWLTRRAARTDLLRASVLVWGGWLVTTALTFSFMAGIFHAYYTVALAPMIGAMVGIGAWLTWTHRRSVAVLAVAAGTVALTSAWSFALLGRSADFVPWLRWVVLIGGLAVAAAIVFLRVLPRRLALGIAGLSLLAVLAGPAAYAVQTTTTGHEGSIPSAGPTSGQGGPGGGGTGRPGGFGGQRAGGQQQGQAPGGGQAQGGNATQGQGRTGGGGAGGVGGLLNGSTSSTRITAMLQADASDYRWAAAAVGSNSASGYQLASEEPVMAIGGFNGTDPYPTLAQFKAYVAAGEIHYFIAGGGMGGGPGGSGSSTSSAISSWVEDNYTATTVDGVTVYDLSGATS